MGWQRAAAEAGAIAQGWTRQNGPGGAILLFDGSDIRAEAAGGFASLDNLAPFRADTAVRYASISKHFCTAMVVQTGLLGLDDPLGQHLDLPEATGKVTVGRALDMTGGIPDAMETLWLLGVSPTASLDRHALLRFVSSVQGLNFEPGTQISYSNTGYRLVQAALEAKGLDYAAALHERFFQPLGLGITLPEDETDRVTDLAHGYWAGPRGWQKGRYGLHYSASGGIAGSGRDLAVWAQALLSGQAPADGLLARLGALRALTDGRATGYGLGLARTVLGDRVLIGHGGSLPGFKNHFLLDPEGGAGVVVVTNREDADAHGLALRVMAALHGRSLPEPAAGMLPEGLFVADDAPAWIETQGGTVTFLGAQSALLRGDDGWAETDSAHMPIRLRPMPGGIEGEIGHRAYRFRPAPGGVAGAWDGIWVLPRHNARFAIATEGGVSRLSIGVGPAQVLLELEPIAPDLALTSNNGTGGPWKQRACLQIAGDELRLITNRSRVLRFSRG